MAIPSLGRKRDLRLKILYFEEIPSACAFIATQKAKIHSF